MAEMTAYLSDIVTDGKRFVTLVPVSEDEENPAPVPSDHTSIGTFEDLIGDSAVMYHHVRDLLYPLGIYDMNNVVISHYEDGMN